jgi:serine/threonine protein kinase
MSPVADQNLADFLDRDHIPTEEKSFLRTFYGYIAIALSYLHEHCIRHKDVKPQVYIAIFLPKSFTNIEGTFS